MTEQRATAPMIEAVGLTKLYGDHVAVDSISFSVARGETVGLLGTNGAGKTTTMRIITGYMPPTSGVARVARVRSRNRFGLEARRHVGYLPESAPLYADLTVEATLRFFGRIRGMESRALRGAVDRVVEAFALADYRDVLVGKLSKGYRQRLGFAVAVLHEPEVVVLDEPTVSIDPVQVVEVRELIRLLGERHTVLLSTHHLAEAASLCERVVILHEGVVAAQGKPSDIALELGKPEAGLEEVFLEVAGATREGGPCVTRSCSRGRRRARITRRPWRISWARRSWG